MKILIAEDDLTSREFLRRLLSHYGECDVAADGVEALDAFLLSLKENKLYDLICLDIMMPRVDGVKVLRYVRELELQKGILPEKRAKIIITSALARTLLVQDAFELGCDAYLAKPVDQVLLLEQLQKLGLMEHKKSWLPSDFELQKKRHACS